MLGQKIDTAPQETRLNKVYLNIKNGAVIRRTPTGEESFSFVEGKVINLFTKERTFRTEKVLYWYLDLYDPESKEVYSIGSPFSSNTFKSIVLSLASDKGIEAISTGATIKIEPYTRNGYDKIATYADGAKLDWITKTLPPLDEVTIGGRTIKDDSKRMKYICSLADTIKSKLRAK